MFGLQLKKKGICQFLVFTCLGTSLGRKQTVTIMVKQSDNTETFVTCCQCL